METGLKPFCLGVDLKEPFCIISFVSPYVRQSHPGQYCHDLGRTLFPSPCGVIGFARTGLRVSWCSCHRIQDRRSQMVEEIDHIQPPLSGDYSEHPGSPDSSRSHYADYCPAAGTQNGNWKKTQQRRVVRYLNPVWLDGGDHH